MFVETHGPYDCWPWLGSIRPNGYGRFFVGGKTASGHRYVSAHRFAYELGHGPPPPGKLVCHTCDNKPCVNPAHLYVGTEQDNARDREERNGAYRTKLQGEAHWRSRLTTKQVIEMRVAYAAGGETHFTLAKRFGIRPRSVGKIVRGEAWGHAGGPRTVQPRVGRPASP